VRVGGSAVDEIGSQRAGVTFSLSQSYSRISLLSGWEVWAWLPLSLSLRPFTCLSLSLSLSVLRVLCVWWRWKPLGRLAFSLRSTSGGGAERADFLTRRVQLTRFFWLFFAINKKMMQSTHSLQLKKKQQHSIRFLFFDQLFKYSLEIRNSLKTRSSAFFFGKQ